MPVPPVEPLRLAAAAYPARYKGPSRAHTESDLRSFLGWCAERSLDPPTAQRAHIELYVRWMQETRRFAPFDRVTADVGGGLRNVINCRDECVDHGTVIHASEELVVRRGRRDPDEPCPFQDGARILGGVAVDQCLPGGEG